MQDDLLDGIYDNLHEVLRQQEVFDSVDQYDDPQVDIEFSHFALLLSIFYFFHVDCVMYVNGELSLIRNICQVCGLKNLSGVDASAVIHFLKAGNLLVPNLAVKLCN